MKKEKINRRYFIWLISCLSFILLPKLVVRLCQRGTCNEKRLLALKLANFFEKKQSAKKIGLEYLKCKPNESNSGLLVEAICRNQTSRVRELGDADPRRLRSLLLLQQREDFGCGNIVNVQGWLLSETEARLCALAAIT